MRDMWRESDWELSDYERGQLEMLIDGEGCIGFKKIKRVKSRRGHTWGVYVMITNTSYDLLERAKEICGGGAINLVKGKAREEAGDRWKDSYYYQIPIRVQRFILPQLSLIVKEEQRLLALEVLSILHAGKDHSDHDEELLEVIYQDIKELNRKGKQ